MKELFAHAPSYCEENVRCLLANESALNAVARTILNHPAGGVGSDSASFSMFAVFVSNPTKTVPFWYQSRARNSPSPVIVWDYHVFAVMRVLSENRETTSSYILDLDSVLPFPCPFAEYMRLACPQVIDETYARFFRVVRAELYIANFASDRRHMRTDDGGWLAAPPDWPPFTDEQNTFNLENFWDMKKEVQGSTTLQFGTVYTQDEFCSLFG
ncbi:hypothetical protein HDU83_007078 [Entophlyctis luteolus]|nr:hypothetical protein HDU82_006712 [Entophlyctis luteolus]KAJ3340462.1 hypothetical protein HDU83_007078 [Entophlyctis luteolus]